MYGEITDFFRPDAISSITQHLRLAFVPGTNPIYLPRSLLILLYVVKELATGRLITRTNLQSATPEVFQVLGTIYITKVQSWLGFIQNGGDNEGGALNSIEHSLLSLRVLRRLFIAGYEFPNRNKDVHELWILVNQRFGEILSLVSQHSHLIHAQVRQLIEKHLVQTSKLHHEMVKTHPAAFVLLPHSFDLAKSYWSLLVEFGRTFGSQTTAVTSKIGTGGGEEEEEEITPCVEKLSLKALLLLRATVKLVYSPTHTFKYQHAEDKEERKLSVENIKSQLLSDSLIREMMETLVTRFFVFRPKDLREWEEEPEEWERREEGEGDAWEFSVRSCAEKLFLDLVINNKALLIEPLLSVFSAVASMFCDLFFDSLSDSSSYTKHRHSFERLHIRRYWTCGTSTRSAFGLCKISRNNFGTRSTNSATGLQNSATQDHDGARPMASYQGRAQPTTCIPDLPIFARQV